MGTFSIKISGSYDSPFHSLEHLKTCVLFWSMHPLHPQDLLQAANLPPSTFLSTRCSRLCERLRVWEKKMTKKLLSKPFFFCKGNKGRIQNCVLLVISVVVSWSLVLGGKKNKYIVEGQEAEWVCIVWVFNGIVCLCVSMCISVYMYVCGV